MGEPDQYNPKEIIHRIGTFFLIVGIVLLILFFLSEQSGETMFPYFCWSVLLLTLGFAFRAQFKRSVTSGGRFRLWNQLTKKKEKKE